MRLFSTAALAALMLLAGCGFSLRGTAIPLPARFATTYFKDELGENDRFEKRVQRLITLGGGQLVSEEAATVSVSVSAIDTRSRQIALSKDGYNKEYERTYKTTVTVIDLKTGVQLGNRELTTIQNLQIDDRYVLAGEEESATSQRLAEQELARKVMAFLKTL